MNIMNSLTLKSLKKNKTRTIVTIIGVILSTAMITAVTTLGSSVQNLLINNTIYNRGDWHARVVISSLDYYEDIINHDQIKDFSLVRGNTYSPLVGGSNEHKPYLHIMELDKKAFTTLPIHLTKGRLPENSNEVLMADHIFENGDVEFKLGQEIELDTGYRHLDGNILNQIHPYVHVDDGVPETFEATGSKKFTVVGFYERFPYQIETFSAPGYDILTCLEDTSLTLEQTSTLSVFIKLKKTKEVFNLESEFKEKYQVDDYLHNDLLLLYEGVSHISTFNVVLTSLLAIIIGLIMVGSIALIYNSFSISVSERRKQFGILSSVGATRKQIINSVFFEALFIASFGIPVGIVSGIFGIGITLYLLKDNFMILLGNTFKVELTLSVSTLAVIAAIIISLITILISAYIPARKSKKLSALDAVRQTSDIKLSAKKVKTSKLTRKIFGIEGDLALKNLKRNKKRYRATVFSLFISVLLFISASAFSMYLTDSIENVYQDYNYHFSYMVNGYRNSNDDYLDVYKDITNLDGVINSSIIRNVYGSALFAKEELTQLAPVYCSEWASGGVLELGNLLPISINVHCLDHESFISYLDELNFTKERFQNPEELTAIIYDNMYYYESQEERFKRGTVFKNQSDKTIAFKIFDNFDELNGDEMNENQIQTTEITGVFADKTPIGVHNSSDGVVSLILDESILQKSKSHLKGYINDYTEPHLYFKAENPSNVLGDINKIIDDSDIDFFNLDNLAEESEQNRSIIIIIKVFTYGFIGLMSLIAISNVFNTITTSINLRRREFAMLKSVGITKRGFNKMLNYECLFYGLKALLYGLPASIFVTFLIYLSIIQGMDTEFYLPTTSIFISVFTVFLVVFISMMYSMRKIRKENILDALKNENF